MNSEKKSGAFQLNALDRNLAVSAPDQDGLVWRALPQTEIELTGLYWFDRERRFRRLPQAPATPFPANVERLANCPAGAKIRFRTDSKRVVIHVKRAGMDVTDTLNYVAKAGFDLYLGGPGAEEFHRVSRSLPSQKEFSAAMFEARVEAPRMMRDFTIYFPLYHPLLDFELGLDKDAQVARPVPYLEPERPIVVYGTSITQGACASRPGLIWTNRLSRMLNRHILNFGFSDGGKCEPVVGETLASIQDPALYVIDCEANLGDAYAEKLAQFLPILLKAHPQVPILVMSRYRMTKWALAQCNVEATRAVADKLRAAGHPVFFFDCSDMLGDDFADCLTDDLHANDVAFARIADALYPEVLRLLYAPGGEDGVRISAPIDIFSVCYDREKVLRNLQSCGIRRILLCGRSLDMDPAKRQELYDRLPGEVKFFQSHGLDVWYWRWAFLLPGHPFTKTVSYRAENKNEVCPLDPDFQALVRDDLTKIAASGVNGILYDDDFRFDNATIGLGCLCDRHKALIEKYLGHAMDWSDLEARVLCGAPTPERNALLAAWGESLKEFSRMSRAAVDAVNPAIRFGLCACLSSYDGDGATAMELAKILAGKTRPYVRLIGAPYWAEHWGVKIRLPEIVEYERWQSAMMPEEFEVFAEGDVWPRPRFQTPAANLEIFDSALRFDGSLDGIQKYMFDYTSSAGYETGYMREHLAHQSIGSSLRKLLAGTGNSGIRVWQAGKLIEKGDFRDVPQKADYLDGPLFYPQAAFALAAHGIPTTYRGPGRAAICFGESARTLPEELKTRPLILDVAAAKILTERGWNLGVLEFGERFQPSQERFPDGEAVALQNRLPGSRRLKLAPEANALSRFSAPDEVASFSFTAPDGGRYLIFNFEGSVSDETSWRNYRFPAAVRNFLTQCGTPLPAVLTTPDPDLYLQCRTGQDSCFIGIWNAHPDRVDTAQIQLGETYRSVQWLVGKGKFDGRTLTIRNLPGLAFMLVKVQK